MERARREQEMGIGKYALSSTWGQSYSDSGEYDSDDISDSDSGSYDVIDEKGDVCHVVIMNRPMFYGSRIASY